MSAGSVVVFARARASGATASGVSWLLKLMYAVVQAPEFVYLGALTAMLFRPPDLQSFPIDRIGFALLLAASLLHLLLFRKKLRLYVASWPMLALLLLGVCGALSQPYDAKVWSVLASKWIVPLALFHVSGLVFRNDRAGHQLERFSMGVLLYLSTTAVCFLFDARSLIFPRFILDEGIGIHVDRARGPFLQAVANGVCLNVLGLVALHSWNRGRPMRVLAAVLFVTTPIALLATKTRSVWISAGLSVLLAFFFVRGRRTAIVGASIFVALALGLCGAWLFRFNKEDLTQRLQERSPVDFRMEMYRAGWQMFTEKPLLGWGGEGNVQPEIARRISGFHLEYFIFHNTYLELAVERGLVGLALYTWLFVALFRLGAEEGNNPGGGEFLGQGFGRIWRIVLFVYLLNASAVVMNYQFLNAYVFTIGGILAARQKQPIAAGGSDEDRLPL